MPWFSFHGGHSGQFCGHAKGRLEDVVTTAIERGFTHYGLSEHCPRDHVEHLYPEEQAEGPGGLARKFEAYMVEARGLQERFKGQIDLLVGFETERLPLEGWETRMADLRSRFKADFIIGSVHDVDGTWVDFSPEMTAQAAEACGGRDALHCKYFAALGELVETLKPEVVGHLDLVRKFDGEGPHFSPAAMKYAERTLSIVRDVGAVLDVNPGAHRRGLSPIYPGPELLALACHMEVGVTLGDDGHGPHDVGAGLEACLSTIAAAGYREVHYLAHQDGVVQLRKCALHEVQPQRR